MDALQQLHDDRHFSENERSIAHYLLDYPEEAAHISSRELARRTFTSASAVLRFCKKLGFENYNDFKIIVVSELKSADLASTMIASGEHVRCHDECICLPQHLLCRYPVLLPDVGIPRRHPDLDHHRNPSDLLLAALRGRDEGLRTRSQDRPHR